MKIVALLFFAFVLVYTAPTKKDEHPFLKDIMETVNKLLQKGPKSFLEMMVPHSFDKERCIVNGTEDFCIAEKILSNINNTKNGIQENHEKIVRVLIQYNKIQGNNCSEIKDEDEEQLRDFLKDLYCCAQAKYSRRNHKRAQRSADGNEWNFDRCGNKLN